MAFRQVFFGVLIDEEYVVVVVRPHGRANQKNAFLETVAITIVLPKIQLPGRCSSLLRRQENKFWYQVFSF